jgi:hypothetical protein
MIFGVIFIASMFAFANKRWIIGTVMLLVAVGGAL